MPAKNRKAHAQATRTLFGELAKDKSREVVLFEPKKSNNQRPPYGERIVRPNKPNSKPASSGSVRSRPARSQRSNSFAPQTGHVFHQKGKEKLAFQAMLHQTMEPVTAPLIRIPVTGFLPTVGTALARSVDTYSRDFSKYLQVDMSSAPELHGAKGVRPMQEDLSVEPLVLFRDPVVSHVQRNIIPNIPSPPNPPSINTSYLVETAFQGEFTAVWVADGDPPFVRYENCLMSFGRGRTIQLPTTGMSHLSGDQSAYSEYVPGGIVGTTRVVWIDASDANSATVTFDFSSDVSDTAGYNGAIQNQPIVIARRHHSETRNEVAAEATCTKPDAHRYNAYFYLKSSGYYSFEVVCPATYYATYADGAQYVCFSEVTKVEIKVDMTSSVYFQHVMSEAMLGKEDIVKKMRVNGSSMLIQNTSAELARGGSVYAAQISGDYPWYESIHDVRDVSNLNVASRYVDDWSKGFYGFCKPQGTSPFEMTDVWDDLGDAEEHLHMPMFRPFSNTGTVVVQIQPPTPTENNFSSTLYTLHVIRALEFTTNDQFFDVEVPVTNATDFGLYSEALSSVPQFYCNPLHIALIGRLIFQAAQFAVKWGPTALTAAKMLLSFRQERKAGG